MKKIYKIINNKYRYLVSILLNFIYYGTYKHNYIGKNVTITGNCNFGNYVIIRDNVEIRTTNSEINIGDECSLNRNAMVLGKVTLKKGVRVGPNTVIVGSNHNFDDVSIYFAKNGFHTKGITIENNVWIGANVTVLDGVRVGKNSIIGAGSVVTKNIPDNCIAVGNPCKVLKLRQ